MALGRLMAIPVAVATLLATVACGTGSTREADEAAVRGIVQSFDTSINSRDFGPFASTLTPDFTLSLTGQPTVTGPDVVREELERSWVPQSRERQVKTTVSEIRFPADNVAHVQATHTFSTTDVPGPTYRVALVMVRVDDQWKWASTRQQ